MRMITHQSNFSPLPFKIKISLRKRYWYLFPQGWSSKTSLTARRGGRWFKHPFGQMEQLTEHTNLFAPEWYQISWLFIDIKITITYTILSKQSVIERNTTTITTYASKEGKD